MNKSRKTRQQIKDEQINYLLGDVEKSLEEYRKNLELTGKQLSDTKKLLLSAKQGYHKTYIESLKQRFQKQQIQFLEKQRNYYQEKKQPPKI